MPRPLIRHWRFLILLACLAVALLDAKLDPARKSLTIAWHPVRQLRVDEGVRAIERGLARLWQATPRDTGVQAIPVRIGTRASGNHATAPRSTAKAARTPEGRAPEQHSAEDRRRLDRAISGN